MKSTSCAIQQRGVPELRRGGVACQPAKRSCWRITARRSTACRAQPVSDDAGAPPLADGGTSFSRRRAAAVALLLPRAGAALLAAAWQGACLSAGAAEQPSSSASKASFYSEYPYIQPSDILPYLRDRATPGDVSSVLAAIDDFAAFYPMYRCGPEKGAILERLVAQQRPTLVLELGTFMGYGTARIARQLPPGGRIVSIEAGEEQAAVAREVLRFAGLPVGEGPDSPIQVINGLSGEALPALRQAAGLPEGAAAGFVFLDHCKPCYLPDLVAMERLGLVAPGSLVLADNVLIPGAPDFLAHVGAATGPGSGGTFGPPSSSAPGSSAFKSGSKGSSRRGGSVSGSGAGDSSSSGLAWSTELVETAYEVEERYKVDWQPRKDAMSISLCQPPESA